MVVDDQNPGWQDRSIVRHDEQLKDHDRRIVRLETDYVHKNQYGPVEKIVYGIAAAGPK